MRTRFSILSLAVSLLALPALAQVTPPVMPMAIPISTAAPTKPVKSQSRIFEVADFVHTPILIPGAAVQENTRIGNAKTLTKLIVAMVKSESWERHGGAGKLDFIAASDCLCVTNSPEIVADVAKMLENLRKMQDRSVMIQVSFFTMPAGFGAKAGWVEKGKTSTKLWTACETEKANELMKTEKQLCMLSAPTLCLFDGQVGMFGQIVPDLQPRTLANATEPTEPKSVEVGLKRLCTPTVSADGQIKLLCTPTVSADGQSIQLKMETDYWSLSGTVSSPINRVYNSSIVVLSEGNSALVFLGNQKAVERIQTRVQALSQVPYLDRMFRTESVTPIEQEVYQIVTARVLKR